MCSRYGAPLHRLRGTEPKECSTQSEDCSPVVCTNNGDKRGDCDDALVGADLFCERLWQFIDLGHKIPDGTDRICIQQYCTPRVPLPDFKVKSIDILPTVLYFSEVEVDRVVRYFFPCMDSFCVVSFKGQEIVSKKGHHLFVLTVPDARDDLAVVLSSMVSCGTATGHKVERVVHHCDIGNVTAEHLRAERCVRFLAGPYTKTSGGSGDVLWENGVHRFLRLIGSTDCEFVIDCRCRSLGCLKDVHGRVWSDEDMVSNHNLRISSPFQDANDYIINTSQLYVGSRRFTIVGRNGCLWGACEGHVGANFP